MPRIIFVFTFILFFSAYIPTHAQAIVFERNLRLGDQGVDVFELQRVLNSDARTRVSEFGPGSPGNETYYFGSLTMEAVIRFQNIHADRILVPEGLVYGTGFVGARTRAVLGDTDSSVSDETPVNPQISTPTNTAISSLGNGLFDTLFENGGKPFLMQPSSFFLFNKK